MFQNAKAGERNTEPWGRTPWFYKGRRMREGQPTTSISGPATRATASRRGTRVRSPYPLTPRNLGGRFAFPRRIRTLYPPRKHKPRRPFLFSLARLGPRSSAAGPTKEGSTNDSKSRAEAPVRSALNQFPANGMPRPTQKNIHLTKIKSLSLTREGTDATPRVTLLESPRGSGATPIGCARAHPLAK